MKSRLRLVFHLREIVADGGKKTERSKTSRHSESSQRIARHHDAAHPNREANHLPGVWAPFRLVGFKQPRPQFAPQHGREFPRQVVSVANSAIHPLSGERRTQMRGIAG